MEVPISAKSRNILTLLFSLFVSNSSGSIFSSQLAQKTLTKESYSKKKSLLVKIKTLFSREDSLSGKRFHALNTSGRGSLNPNFASSSHFLLSFLGLQGSQSKVPSFSFLILFYVFFIGLEGSATRFLSHEQRLLLTKNLPGPLVLGKNCLKDRRNEVLPTRDCEGQRPQGGEHIADLKGQSAHPLEGRVGRSPPSGEDSRESSSLFFLTKLSNRLSTYSPIVIENKHQNSVNSLAFQNERTEVQYIQTVGTNFCSSKYLVKLSELNLDSNKHLLRLTHVFTQLFVFSVVQKIISDNNFGRNNPLRQKDQKTNQARILWPKNKFSFWPFKSGNTNKLPNLPGIQELSPLIQVLIESLQNTKQLKTTSFAPKGYLFVGPPGTGKTLLAQEIAQIAKVPFICVSASEIQKQIEIGTRIGALRLRKLFEQARALTPCILFFDEIDAIAQRQQPQHDSKLFTEFLVQMDSWGSGKGKDFKINSQAVLLGTTNYLSKLDSAFVRSGRFDRILALSYPSKKIRFDILKFYITKTSSVNAVLSNSLLQEPKIVAGSKSNKLIQQVKNFEGTEFFPRDPPPNWGEAFGPRGEPFEAFGPLFSPAVRAKGGGRVAGEGYSKVDIFLGSALGLNYFAYSTDGFSQAHLARMVNESLLFAISAQEKRQQTKIKKDSLHSFESLLHGLEKMNIHRETTFKGAEIS
uniref:Cell division protein n=1 Tax=Monomastix sp. (strain OKE-1) TaxID=141716 RepID=C0JWL6_MONSK|nr:cell division protein [Monomastix sp. OKE-1]ACK36911.1 cell division protein [Monomastix sp. OKE-1]